MRFFGLGAILCLWGCGNVNTSNGDVFADLSEINESNYGDWVEKTWSDRCAVNESAVYEEYIFALSRSSVSLSDWSKECHTVPDNVKTGNPSGYLQASLGNIRIFAGTSFIETFDLANASDITQDIVAYVVNKTFSISNLDIPEGWGDAKTFCDNLDPDRKNGLTIYFGSVTNPCS